MGSSTSLALVLFLVFAGEIMTSEGIRRSNTQNNKGQRMVAPMEEDELLALFEVMSGLLEDPEWAQAHPQPCTDTPWPGLECEVSTTDPPIFHVTKIHVGPDILSPPCKKSAFLSQSLLKLNYLKTLSLFNCFVASSQVITLPKTLFGTFSSLEHLALENNPSLSGEIPTSLGDVGSLRVLSLSQNSLQGNIPSKLGGLVCLEQLDLSYNNLNGSIPMEIGKLKKMTILDLSWNSIEGAIPHSIGQLQLLQKMDLHSNMLVGNIPHDLGNLKRLVLLDLSHNFIEGPIPETLSGMEVLEYLIIDNNPIKERVPLFIGKLNKLKSLSLSGCELNGPLPNLFFSLKNLTAISLGNNRLSGPVPKVLGLLPNLDQLNISYNNLSGVLELPEYFITKLGKRLDVRGNNELCTSDDDDQPNRKKNFSSYLGIPSCFTMVPRTANSFAAGPVENPSGIKPSWYNNIISSCPSLLQGDLRVILFTLGLNLVWLPVLSDFI
ncbi:receptor like protein 29-like [Arachis stenosperma]|uniref:receptor like protein 29-like n=1 Tax=Arachis stenosperma TaxID=217475 RepID=UPI0025ACCDDE|nr:receptor like protein 29-like [Arachis stenosperma]